MRDGEMEMRDDTLEMGCRGWGCRGCGLQPAYCIAYGASLMAARIPMRPTVWDHQTVQTERHGSCAFLCSVRSRQVARKCHAQSEAWCNFRACSHAATAWHAQALSTGV